jgi:hypothetical protein
VWCYWEQLEEQPYGSLRSTLGTWREQKNPKYMSKPLNKTMDGYLYKGFSFEKNDPKLPYLYEK